MIEDLGECQNTGIRVLRIVTNGRTQYLTSRHRNNPDRVFAGIEAHQELEQETPPPYLPGPENEGKKIAEMIRQELEG